MAKKPSLKDTVLASMDESRNGKHRTWFDKMTDGEQKNELLEIRRAWQAGEIRSPGATLARHISASLRSLGLSSVGQQGVWHWLKRND
jgi:hypothetical protein